MFKNRQLMIFSVLLLAVLGVIFYVYNNAPKDVDAGNPGQKPALTKVMYGISPYQDTILPRVAEKLGWDKTEGLDIDTITLDWGDVMPSLASGAVDVAIQNFSSFQASYENINSKGGDVLFYYPFFVFKGAGVIARSDSGVKSYDEMKAIHPDKHEALVKTIKQFKGKRISATLNTEMNTLVTLALKTGGLASKEVDLIHAQPSDGLQALLNGDVQLFSGGVTEQLQATKAGHKQVLTGIDVGMVVIDGLVTTKHFAEQHPEVLRKLVDLWFKTTAYIDADVEGKANVVLEDLNKEGSFQFSPKDYLYVWRNTEVFPLSRKEMEQLVGLPTSPYSWKKSWDENNTALIQDKTLTKPVPYEAFWPYQANAF